MVEDEDDLEQQGVEIISSANNSQIMLQQRSKCM